MLVGLEVQLSLLARTDSSTAIGTCSRQGIRKLRHLDTHTLLIQQAVRTGRVDLRKVAGEKNPADLLTKHLGSSEKLHQLVQLYGCHFLSGRAESALKTRTQPTDKVRIAEADQLQGMEEQDEKGDCTMPHMMYTKDDLDVEYPSLQLPHDDALDDVEECDQAFGAWP